jgi:hypothetical protein
MSSGRIGGKHSVTIHNTFTIVIQDKCLCSIFSIRAALVEIARHNTLRIPPFDLSARTRLCAVDACCSSAYTIRSNVDHMFFLSPGPSPKEIVNTCFAFIVCRSGSIFPRGRDLLRYTCFMVSALAFHAGGSGKLCRLGASLIAIRDTWIVNHSLKHLLHEFVQLKEGSYH